MRPDGRLITWTEPTRAENALYGLTAGAYDPVMSDESIAARIESLVAEEHTLRTRERSDSTDEDRLAEDRTRLQAVGVELDRCWDLLRQRRAARDAGLDPDEAHVRDTDTVERYLQ